jgi:putative toxin-antitoxin system antitoxin component (TIGR02293 family)
MATAFSLDAFTAAPPLERAHAVSAGLPAKAVRDLVADPAITLADVARIVGPRRTIDRRLKENKPLSPDESDRFARFVTVLAQATAIFGNRAAAMQWLGTPKRRFEGEKPLDLLTTDAGTRLVEEVLEQARHGFTA